MKCIILAAGYATRLYPLTKNFPKALLEVNNKSIIDYLIDDLETNKYIDEYVLVTNHRFKNIFDEWKKSRKENITILDDKTDNNENRLGAVNDIKFAIDSLNLDDDLLIIASDNLLDFSLNDFIEYAKRNNSSCVMRYVLNDIDKLRKTGVLEIDDNGKIIDMQEKPNEPVSSYACPPFYFYTNRDIKLIDEIIKNGCKTDSPGSLVKEMCKLTNVYTFEMNGNRYDIGNLESYNEVKEIFKSKKLIRKKEF